MYSKRNITTLKIQFI